MYKYRALQQPRDIRLLKLYPGRFGEPLHGSLRQVALGATPFEAISYAWGDDDKCKVLSTAEGDIAITLSLYTALQRLRTTTSPRLLWADAVCINQENTDEKVSQVKIMGDIYRAASCTLVILLQTPGRRLRFQDQLRTSVLCSINSIANTLRHKLPTTISFFSDIIAEMGAGLLVPQSVLDMPWFDRTWVVQEYLLGRRRRIICDFFEELDSFELSLAQLVSLRTAA